MKELKAHIIRNIDNISSDEWKSFSTKEELETAKRQAIEKWSNTHGSHTTIEDNGIIELKMTSEISSDSEVWKISVYI